jgi:isocitrate dehydrogenase kinase/phosphatase
METDLAPLVVGRIIAFFDQYRTRFQSITRRAADRFGRRDWRAMRSDAKERIFLYKAVLTGLTEDLGELMGDRIADHDLWMRMKPLFMQQCRLLSDLELAETWFNSVTRQVFKTVGVDPAIEFTLTREPLPSKDGREPPLFRTYHAGREGTTALFEALLGDFSSQIPFTDPVRDAGLIAQRVEAHLVSAGESGIPDRVEMLQPVFFRGMGAYVVGRLLCGSYKGPLVIAALHGPGGLYADAVLLRESDVSILFSFTRSSFHVGCDRSSELIRFLASVLPKKRAAELYMAIGHTRHGKTELYRDIQRKVTDCTTERFERAPGQRGLVMEVFGIPGYDIVFKLIKDRFPYPKSVTRKQVMDKYDLVFMHDRAGRLVEAQPYEYLTFAPCCFSGELLKELQASAAATVHAGDRLVTVDFAYAERRVTPLDIYLSQTDTDSARAAVVDFGNAIKDLARSNIFAGDFLLKNFGVTRHGRVVFYDYDELCLLNECHFRKMPEARRDEDALSNQPWFMVGENDVFPEEFEKFMGLNRSLMAIFKERHGDLFGVDFWRDTQDTIRAGNWCHIFPYPPERRLDQPRDAICDLWDAGC